MARPRLPEVVDIGPGAGQRLAVFCRERLESTDSAAGLSLRLVADRITWKAAGAETELDLRAAGIAVRPTIIEEPPAADAAGILRLLIDDDPAERLFVAVGSGTITDIVRFVCHRTGREFVCLATAPSVDAYASVVAPIIVDGLKVTVPASAPVAVFADTEILAQSPRQMIAAGFGDMICKFSAVADWRLGALLWGESFDEAIAARSIASAVSCAGAAEAIGAARQEGLAALMAALVESGTCMAEAGHSRPASGAEHHYSHFWELKLLQEGRPPILHGLKVAIGTLETARLWDLIKSLTKSRASELLAAARLPSRENEEASIREAFSASDTCSGDRDETVVGVIAAHERFLSMESAEYESLKSKILDNWDKIVDIARTVPGVAETARLLAQAGCPTDPRELGLGPAEIAIGLKSAHYLRDRFTIKKLTLALGIDQTSLS